MCRILLSIKPEYVEQIIEGNKKFEFRRNRPKRNVDSIVIYASAPEKKIIGEFSVKEVHKKEINELWNYTSGNQGIKYDDFKKYYEGKEEGYAYEIRKLKIYSRPKKLEELNIKFAPQSFMYLD